MGGKLHSHRYLWHSLSIKFEDVSVISGAFLRISVYFFTSIALIWHRQLFRTRILNILNKNVISWIRSEHLLAENGCRKFKLHRRKLTRFDSKASGSLAALKRSRLIRSRRTCRVASETDSDSLKSRQGSWLKIVAQNWIRYQFFDETLERGSGHFVESHFVESHFHRSKISSTRCCSSEDWGYRAAMRNL